MTFASSDRISWRSKRRSWATATTRPRTSLAPATTLPTRPIGRPAGAPRHRGRSGHLPSEPVAAGAGVGAGSQRHAENGRLRLRGRNRRGPRARTGRTALFVNHLPNWQLIFEHERELQTALVGRAIEEFAEDLFCELLRLAALVGRPHSPGPLPLRFLERDRRRLRKYKVSFSSIREPTRKGRSRSMPSLITPCATDAVHVRSWRRIPGKSGTSLVNWPNSITSRALCHQGRAARFSSAKRRSA